MGIIEEAKAFRKKVEELAQNITDEEADENVNFFAKWEVGVEYVTDTKVRYNDVVYKVLQDHTSQEDWTPDVAVSLFVRCHQQSPEDEYPEWVQPTGSHDAYQKGDKVTHNEKRWESLIDANVWEPGTVGTEALWAEVE